MPAQQPLWADAYAPGVPLHLDYGDTTVLDLWESAVFVDELPTNSMGKVLRREVAVRLRKI